MATLTKHQVLVWGMKHIAKNRDLNSEEEELFGATSHYILTLEEPSVPLICDVNMLAEDLGLKDYVDTSWAGIEIYVSDKWKDTIGEEPYDNSFPMWKRSDVEIGSEI